MLAGKCWVKKNYGSRTGSWIGSRIGSCLLKLEILRDEPWTKASERYLAFHQSDIEKIRKTRVNPQLLLKYPELLLLPAREAVGSHSSHIDRPQCFTLQGQSLGCYSRSVTSHGSLRYFTNEKLFQWNLVCHVFLSITLRLRLFEIKNSENTFVFLTTPENQMPNCLMQTGMNSKTEQPIFFGTKTEKPN